MSTERKPVVYLPIADPDLLLEGCFILLRSLIQRIIEGKLNGFTEYTIGVGSKRVKVVKLEIEFLD